MRDFNRRLSWQRRWLNQQTNEPKPNERKSMNKKFDELTKSMAQSVTRRGALKKFGVGLAGMALACFGLANRAEGSPRNQGIPKWCDQSTNACCCKNCRTWLPSTDPNYPNCQSICSSPWFG